MSTVTLAVAGARKTQSIVDRCCETETGPRRLVLTYTLAGQDELASRLERMCPPARRPHVLGWYSFLMRHVIRPYLPLLYPQHRLTGLNFDGEPAKKQYAKGVDRYLDPQGRAYKLHLSKFAYEVMKASDGAPLARLHRIYDEIHIDEVQDLTGYDLEIVEAVLKTCRSLHMVGDVRQSLISTNPQDSKNSQYRGLDMVAWFQKQEKAGRLSILHSSRTFRSNQAIADFADSVFSKNDFPATTSLNLEAIGHDGIFALADRDLGLYMQRYSPQCLRYSANSGKGLGLDFQTFGRVKGLAWDHVLIHPTAPIQDFLMKGRPLTGRSACGLYVAVTRARFSVAFLLPATAKTSLTWWRPSP